MQFLGPAPKGIYAPFGPIPDRGLVPPGLTLCLATAPGVVACFASLSDAFTACALLVLPPVDAADEVVAAPQLEVPTAELTGSWRLLPEAPLLLALKLLVLLGLSVAASVLSLCVLPLVMLLLLLLLLLLLGLLLLLLLLVVLLDVVLPFCC